MARAGEAIEIPKTGERIVFRKTAADTDGELLQLDFFVAPNGFAPRRHVHARVEERIALVSGTLRYYVGGKEGILEPGESVVLPAGVSHTFWNDGTEVAHFIADVRPALNMETLFETIFGLYRDGKTDRRGFPNLLQNLVLAREYDGYLPRLPIGLQRLFVAAAAPVGRLLGYRTRYPEYSGPE